MGDQDLFVYKRIADFELLHKKYTSYGAYEYEAMGTKTITLYQILIPITKDIKAIVDTWLDGIDVINVQWINKYSPTKRIKDVLSTSTFLTGIKQQGWFGRSQVDSDDIIKMNNLNLSVDSFQYYDDNGDIVTNITEETAVENSYYSSLTSFRFSDVMNVTKLEAFCLGKEDYNIENINIAFAISFMIRRLQWESWYDSIKIFQYTEEAEKLEKESKCIKEIEIFDKLSDYFSVDKASVTYQRYRELLSVDPFRDEEEASFLSTMFY